MSRTTVFTSVKLAAAVSLLLGGTWIFTADAQQSNQTNQSTQNRDANTQNSNQTNRGDQATDQSRGGQTTAGQQGQQHGQWKNPDHLFATCIALGNQEEVAISQIGLQKAQSEEVKKFAQMMVSDHQEYLSKLQRFAPEAGAKDALGGEGSQRQPRTGTGTGTGAGREGANQGANRDATSTDTANRDTSSSRDDAQKSSNSNTNAGASRSTNTSAGTRSDNAQGHVNLMQIERELAQQCLASATQKLNEKSGAEFDKCFMGIQISKHMGMKDKLAVFQKHASNELRQILAEGEKTTEHHLAQAEQIMKGLEGGSKGGSEKSQDRSEKSK